jgi:hypothetical protein
MINRPKNLELIECSLIFNNREFHRVEIDLSHINREGRSNFLAHEAYLILVKLIEGALLEHHDERIFVNGTCQYYQETGRGYNNKWYKIVFCTCTDRPNAIGLITLFRVKEKKNESL